ncbi:PAS domain-containing sensor histidine kinase [Catenovulum sediminis]|uniref:histidine kinase n=1 Tax=Catenovulum sediminis TaxID=1740262 RepID=A0ABV1RJS6_9ALTE
MGAVIYFYSKRHKQYKDYHHALLCLYETLSQNHEQIWRLDLQNRELVYYDANLSPTPVTTLDWESEEHLKTWVYADDIEQLQKKFKDFLAGKENSFCAEYRQMLAPKKWRWVQLRGNAYTSAKGDKFMYGLLLNIEHLINTQQQLERSLSELTEAKSELSFSADITANAISEMAYYQDEMLIHKQMADIANRVPEFTHEINTPIGICVTAISHMQQSLEQLTDKTQTNKLTKNALTQYQQESKETFELIESNIQRATNLIQSFKQITVDQTSEQLRHFKLLTLIQDTLNTLHPKLKKTQHQVKLDISENVELYSYPGPLSQVFINLVNNSLSHGFKNIGSGDITLTLFDYASGDDEVLILYRDNGLGISQQNQEKMFDPYFTTNRSEGNTGLGMPIIKTIIEEKLAGELLCNSLEGAGVEFYIRLPVNIEKKISA